MLAPGEIMNSIEYLYVIDYTVYWGDGDIDRGQYTYISDIQLRTIPDVEAIRLRIAITNGVSVRDIRIISMHCAEINTEEIQNG